MADDELEGVPRAHVLRAQADGATIAAHERLYEQAVRLGYITDAQRHQLLRLVRDGMRERRRWPYIDE